MSLFPEAVVNHLPRIKSYHNPILFSSKPLVFVNRPRPFRCEHIWICQPDFIDLTKTIWLNDPNRPVFESLNILKDKAIQWNKNSFGNLFHKKRRLFARLEGINRALSNGPCAFLEKLQTSLSIDFQRVLALEKEFWASKSRVEWLNLGDSNTSFFYASVIQRRSNRILSLKNFVGNWMEKDEEISNYICNYFHSLFSCNHISEFPQDIVPNPSFIGLFSSLSAILDDIEIRDALFDLKPFKAAWFDWFQAAFFQQNWSFLSSSISNSIQSTFHEECVPEEWNRTLVCLIPKCSNPSEIKSFRSISLCTTAYKIISKILVRRLKPILPSLISFNQGAFVPFRKTSDKELLA